MKSFRWHQRGLLLLNILMGFAFSTTATEKIYEGRVEPITSTYVSFAYDDGKPGRILYTAVPGTIVKGPILNATGDAIAKGGVLVKFHPGRRKDILIQKQARLQETRAVEKFAKKHLERMRQLYDEKRAIVPQERLEQAESNYHQAKAEALHAAMAVSRAKIWFANSVLRADYDCLVTKVHLPTGLCYVGSRVLDVVQLNPIGIHIPMKRDEAYAIDATTVIKVFPRGAAQETRISGRGRIVTDDGVLLKARNGPISPTVNLENGENIVTAVHEWFSVETFRDDSFGTLAVPAESIFEDDNGSYVLKVAEANLLTANEKIDDAIPVEKISVELTGRSENFSPHVVYAELNDTKRLAVGDVVLKNDEKTKTLNDGDTVRLYSLSYRFMPGDVVKVVIEQ